MTTLMQKRKEQMKISSIADLKRKGKVTGGLNPALFVHGPEEFDCLVNKWSRQELLGLIGDSGTGKSEVALEFFLSILLNNPESSCVYISLEMTDEKIAQRWFHKVENTPGLTREQKESVSERLYVLSRFDENGKSRDVSVGWIKRELIKYKETIGDVISFVCDHLHILSDNDPSTLNSIVVSFKEMSVELNSFGIIMAQVNKSSGKKGEVPLDADSVLGCSQLKYCCSDIIQIHRPILRLEEEAKVSILSWSYVKIREANKDDKVRRGQNKLLNYDIITRGFRKLTSTEFSTFKLYYNELLEMKSSEEKHNAHSYHLQKEIQQPNGKVVVVSEIFSGSKDDL